MGLGDKLVQALKGLGTRRSKTSGRGTSPTPADIRREILAMVESKFVVGRGGKMFPFGKVVVTLQPLTETQSGAFKAEFVEGGSLEADVRRMIRESCIQDAEGLQILVRLSPVPASGELRPAPGPLFQLDFVEAELQREREVPEIRIVVTKGAAEQGEYRFKKGHILIGRLKEVLDREGRLIRKNDLAFLDNGSDINSSVSPIQARIWFDDEKRRFLLMDEVSRYGTRIVRRGRTIEAPPGGTRGVRLGPGDEVYFGQACVRVELPEAASEKSSANSGE